MWPFLTSTNGRPILKKPEVISQKILTLPELLRRAAQWRVLNHKIAFTNGVFDILHPGHIFSLSQAAREADYLVVGLNSDESVNRLKGNDRPINKQDSRALVLAALLVVDAVIIFEEDTPLALINALRPDVLVKGGHYDISQIAGAREVVASGGRVVINSIVEAYSTTAIIDKIKQN